MTIDFTDTLAKIERAYEHVNALKDEIADFESRYPYGLRQDVKDEGRRHIGWVYTYRQPDRLRFGTLIGDAAHNFRSALDHLVFAVAQTTLDPEAFRRYERSLAFPICTTETAWKEALSRRRVKGITGDALGEVQGRQPYKTHDPPERAPLAVLQWLDDRDKHRLIHSVFGAAFFTAAGMTPALTPNRFQLEIFPGPYTEARAKAFELTLLDPIPQMQVNLTPALHVSIRDAAMSEDVRVVFQKIGQMVQRVAFDFAEKSGSPLTQ